MDQLLVQHELKFFSHKVHTRHGGDWKKLQSRLWETNFFSPESKKSHHFGQNLYIFGRIARD
jgi:hypothetical protein